MHGKRGSRRDRGKDEVEDYIGEIPVTLFFVYKFEGAFFFFFFFFRAAF